MLRGLADDDLDPDCPINWDWRENAGLLVELVGTRIPGWSTANLRDLTFGKANKNVPMDAIRHGTDWQGRPDCPGRYKSLLYNGSSDYLSLVADSALAITNNITIFSLVNLTTIGDGRIIFLRGDGDLRWYFYVAGDGGLYLGSRVDIGGLFSYAGADNFPTGRWALVAGTLDASLGSDQIKIYFDGVQQNPGATISWNGAFASNSGTFIGAAAYNATLYWNGSIAGTWVFNRTLNDEEIKSFTTQVKTGCPDRWNRLKRTAHLFLTPWVRRAFDHFTDTPLLGMASHAADGGVVSPSWQVIPAFSGVPRIDIDGVKFNVGGGASGAVLNLTSLASIQATEATLSSSLIGVGVRGDIFGNGYVFFIRDGLSSYIVRYDAGVATNLATGGPNSLPGDIARLEIDNSGHLRALLNDTLVLSATDTTYLGGGAWLIAGPGDKGDDFAAYDLNAVISSGVLTHFGHKYGVDLDLDCPINWDRRENTNLILDLSVPPVAGWRGAAKIKDLTLGKMNGGVPLNATLVNGATFYGRDGQRPGGYGAVYYNGTDGYAKTPTLPHITDKLTLGFSFNRLAAGDKVHWGQWALDAIYQKFVLQIFSDNIIYWVVSGDGFGGSYRGSDSSYSITGWHQIVGTYDGVAGVMKVFLDGIEIASTQNGAVPASLFDANSSFGNIYNLAAGSPAYSKGQADSVFIFNRVLTPEEVKSRYLQDGLGNPDRWSWLPRLGSLLATGGATAIFVTRDDTTKGSWVGVYGADGYEFPDMFLSSSLPGYVSGLSIKRSDGAAADQYMWGSGSEARQLQDPVNPSGTRYAITWFDNLSNWIEFIFDVGSTPRQLALYVLDYDGNRDETITIYDADTALLLDTETVGLNGAGSGSWFLWTITGHLRIRITKTAGSNPVAAALLWDTPGGGAQELNRTSTDAPTTSEAISRLFSGSRILTDAPTVSESVSRAVALVRMVTESLTLGESVVDVKNKVVTAVDAPQTSESTTRLLSGARSATESLSLSEDTAKTQSGTRTGSDAPSTSENLVRSFTGTRSATEVPTTADIVSRSLTNTRAVTDAPTTAESSLRLYVGLRTATEAPTTTMSVSRSFTGVRAATDAPTTSETTNRSLAETRTTTDNPTVAIDVASLVSFTVTASESVQASHSVTRSLIGNRTVSEGPTVSEEIIGFKGNLAFCTEVVTVSGQLTRTISGSRTATDAPQTAGSVSSVLASVRQVIDAVSVSVTASRQVAYVRSASDVLAVAEIAVVGIGYTRTAQEAVTVTVVPIYSVAAQRSAVEAVTVTIALSRSVGISRTANDTIVLFEHVVGRVSVAGASTAAFSETIYIQPFGTIF
jgi:hypothetical protein